MLDYQAVQYRVLPWAATSVALHFTGLGMVAMHRHMASRMDADDDSLTAETHAIGSCLKMVCTTATVDGIEELRRACGGHGFSDYSGLPALYGNAMVNYTGEGEACVQPIRLHTRSFFHKMGGWWILPAAAGIMPAHVQSHTVSWSVYRDMMVLPQLDCATRRYCSYLK